PRGRGAGIRASMESRSAGALRAVVRASCAAAGAAVVLAGASAGAQSLASATAHGRTVRVERAASGSVVLHGAGAQPVVLPTAAEGARARAEGVPVGGAGTVVVVRVEGEPSSGALVALRP